MANKSGHNHYGVKATLAIDLHCHICIEKTIESLQLIADSLKPKPTEYPDLGFSNSINSKIPYDGLDV